MRNFSSASVVSLPRVNNAMFLVVPLFLNAVNRKGRIVFHRCVQFVTDE